MKEEVGSFTLDHEGEGSKRSRIRCIIMCVTLITLLGLCIVLALAFTYATDAPGLLVHPENVIVLESWRDPAQVHRYVNSLNAFAATYDNYEVDQPMKECSESEDKGNSQCVFKLSWLPSSCNAAEGWGYYQSKPCVLLSLNEPKDWVPEPYTSPEQLPTEMPPSLRRHIKSSLSSGKSTKFLWVSCSGEAPADVENLGEVTLSPWQGFPSYYFPLRHDTKQLATPILSLQFPDATKSVLIGIRCHFWAKNLQSPHTAARIEFLAT